MSFEYPGSAKDQASSSGANGLVESTSNIEVTVDHSLQEKHDSAVASPPYEKPEYATGVRLFLIMFTMFMSTLLVALEIGIIATAIPGITNDFNRLDDVGWYGSATFIVGGAAAPMWGKSYKYLHVKHIYLTAVALFLVGSIVAAAAPNSESVIVGRAIQGLGATGVLSGSVLVINLVSHPRSHPVLIGIWMAVFMISTILGPIVGGAFTSEVSWRWCFWINLPVGGPIVILLLFCLHIPKHVKRQTTTWKEVILQLDIPGFSVLLASLVCLTLALQWGGQTKAWHEGTVIATLVLWISFTIIFIVVESLQGTRAMVPLRLLKPRLTWANVLFCFISNSALYQVMFYLPIYLQSIRGKSAIKSGVETLPFLAFFALGSMASGASIGHTRHLQPYQLASALLTTSGMAIFYNLAINSSQAYYIGAQVLFGFGIGLGNQVPMTAVQGLSKPEDVAPSTGIMLMAQALSGGYFLVAAQSLFSNRMLQTLMDTAPNMDAFQVVHTGASEIQNVFSGPDLDAVIGAYMVGINDVFALALAGTSTAVLLSLVVPFKKLPDHGNKDSGTSKIV